MSEINSDYSIASSPNYKGTLSSKSVITGKDASQLNMDDFFNLLVAQMTNQDMLNPNTDTEYIAQMAQFTTLKGIQTIQEYQLSSYAASYVGKTVAIAHVDDNGDMTRTEGVVESVTFYDGEPKVIVGGISYPLYSVMEVKTPGSSTPEEEDDDTINYGNMSYEEISALIGKTVNMIYSDDEGNHDWLGIIDEVFVNDDDVIMVVIDGAEYPASAIAAVQ